ncbi:hypothetical protein KEJ27_01190 [Candidatus Bathyarchaeota archaeon]|nr:hypothetical protein [Candidatus Bathyarchaeota archaeon]MBS7613855.1 hypothetical protein [Candidatus Bathyarchaeota archaeon]MBS7618550.1 hypothetical protein [Candidatus Bathyarchaeota archaeon]
MSGNLNPQTLEEFVREATEIANSKGFHVTWDNVPIYLMLVVTELSEAMEAWRDDDPEAFKEEIADTLIRIFHMCGDLKIDISNAVNVKMSVNRARPYKHGRKRV